MHATLSADFLLKFSAERKIVVSAKRTQNTKKFVSVLSSYSRRSYAPERDEWLCSVHVNFMQFIRLLPACLPSHYGFSHFRPVFNATNKICKLQLLLCAAQSGLYRLLSSTICDHKIWNLMQMNHTRITFVFQFSSFQCEISFFCLSSRTKILFARLLTLHSWLDRNNWIKKEEKKKKTKQNEKHQKPHPSAKLYDICKAFQSNAKLHHIMSSVWDSCYVCSMRIPTLNRLPNQLVVALRP